MFCINFELCNWLLSWLLRSVLLRWLGELKMMHVVGVVACEEEHWLLAVWHVPMWVPRSARKDQYAPKYSAFKVLWKMDKRDLLVNFVFGQSWLSMPQGESSERDLSDSADSCLQWSHWTAAAAFLNTSQEQWCCSRCSAWSLPVMLSRL